MMHQTLVERLIGVYNRASKNLDEKHPLIGKVRKRFFSGKRYGFQFLDDDGNVVEEYTLVTKGPYVYGYSEGINDVCLTKAVKKCVLDDFLEDEDEFVKNPLRYTLKTLPRSVKYLVNKDKFVPIVNISN